MADELPTGAGERAPEGGAAPAPARPAGAAKELWRRLPPQPMLVAAVVALAALGVILPFVAGASATAPGTGSSAPAAHRAAAGHHALAGRSVVARALSATIAEGSADLTMSGDFTAGSTHVSFTATGQLDIAAHSVDLHEKSTSTGQSLTQQVIVTDGTLYADFPGIGIVVPGKSWVSEDLSSLQTGATAWTEGLGMTSDPMNVLQLLVKGGGTLHALGPSTQDGTPVQGYEVVMDQSAISSAVASAGLPTWLRQAVSTVDLSDIDVTAYIDAAGLLRSAAIAITAKVATTAVVVQDHVELSTYGTTVAVQAPTPATVVTVAQFLSAAAQQGG